jgi:uncharacterized protein
MTSQSQQYVLVTGATSGIGYELAKIFAANSYNLIIVSRPTANLMDVAKQLADQYQIDVVPIAKDLFNKTSPFELYEEVKSRGLKVTILVNNAGQGHYGRFIDTDIEKELDIIQLNIAAYVVLTKLFLRDMASSNAGKILNIASIAGKVPGPYQSVYHGTKAFVHSFTEAIRAELDGYNITITSLLPGATNTNFFDKAGMEESKILEHELADPAKVAADGFNALMNGDDMIISGLKNKVQVAMSNVTPDSTVAKQMLKQQEPSDNY